MTCLLRGYRKNRGSTWPFLISGLTYKIDLENEPQEGDRVFDGPVGMKLYVDKKSFLFLVGTVLDWSGGLNGKGFQFANPNAVSTCGCGESFGV